MDTPQAQPTYWRKCTTCKKLIGFGAKYWVCSVSTCNRQRTGLVFCNVACFDAHIPVMNHRDAGAFEKKSPTLQEHLREQEKEKEKLRQQSAPAAAPNTQPAQPPKPSAPPASASALAPSPAAPAVAYRRTAPGMPPVARTATPTPTPMPSNTSPASQATGQAQLTDDEILVVVSKVKAYIKARADMNTSDSVMEVLSKWVRIWARDGIRQAKQDGRKTVLDRDLRK